MTVRQMKMRLFQALPLGDTVVDKGTENCLKYKKTTDYLLCFSPLRDPLLLVGRGNLNLAEVMCQHRYVLLTYPLREGPFYQSSGEKSEDKEAFCMELPGSGESLSCFFQPLVWRRAHGSEWTMSFLNRKWQKLPCAEVHGEKISRAEALSAPSP